jgi:hypothetical protein
MAEAEPALIRAAQKGIVHRNSAQRKVSRLSHQIAKLGKNKNFFRTGANNPVPNCGLQSICCIIVTRLPEYP